MLRGRFAPTPSGQLHIGNVRTALLAWLQIRSAGGTFVLRMEDIDKPRCKPELAAQVLDDLKWLGLDWEEGPDCGGPCGPYVQSERMDRYQAALDRLREADLLYPCFCSRAELMAVASAPHGLASEGPAYPGTCRSLSLREQEARRVDKEPSLRFIMPDREVGFQDGAAGTCSFPPGAGGDFIVKRADGIIGYQLAVVVDDAEMAVTDVLRGCDLLDSTPRQLMLYEALGWNPPRFAHVPLLFGPDGRRLSKRHGSVTVAGIRAAGTAPETVTGVLAFLSGLSDRPEPVTPHELIRGFRLDAVPKDPVIVEEPILRMLGSVG